MQHRNENDGIGSSEVLPGHFLRSHGYEVAFRVAHILGQLLLIVAGLWIPILVDCTRSRGSRRAAFAAPSR